MLRSIERIGKRLSNSGHTFSEDDWRGTNANLYPHFGDYGLIALDHHEIICSGFFDEHWK